MKIGVIMQLLSSITQDKKVKLCTRSSEQKVQLELLNFFQLLFYNN